MGALFLYTIHQTTECRSDFMHTYASLIVDICAKALLRGQVGSTCLPRQSLKPHDSSNNSMERADLVSLPDPTRVVCHYGIKGDMENVDICFEGRWSGLD